MAHTAETTWNADLYEHSHHFVFDLAKDLVSLLNPRAGERILDVGCGTGQLTNTIYQSVTDQLNSIPESARGLSMGNQEIGAVSEMSMAPPSPVAGRAPGSIVGIDPSPTMIENARRNYPNVEFQVMDVTAMPYEKEFDAVFSNAVLHWVPSADLAVARISAALRPGGRFVCEFGARGNVGSIVDETVSSLKEFGAEDAHAVWFYPSIGEYAPILERYGLEVQQAVIFDRPTKLDGEEGLSNWFKMFGSGFAATLSEADRNSAYEHAVARLKPKLYRDGAWYADYRRIRFYAIKV